MKKLFLTLFTLIVLGGTLLAQDNAAPQLSLDSFEQCNNWARHYCLNGNHNAAVNQKLLQLKKRGYIITTKIIRSYAQRVRPNAQVQKTGKVN